MTAIEVHVIGKRQCVAGIAHKGVVSAILVIGTESNGSNPLVTFRVGGLDSEREDHVEWLKRDGIAGKEMTVGNEIVLRIVDIRDPDAPKERRPSSSDGGSKTR